jgi:hypothetical protein
MSVMSHVDAGKSLIQSSLHRKTIAASSGANFRANENVKGISGESRAAAKSLQKPWGVKLCPS